jgi:hypothetical protein
MPLKTQPAPGDQHAIVYTQRGLGTNDPWVETWAMQLRVDDGRPCYGRVVRDEGGIFVIRWKGQGLAVYRREPRTSNDDVGTLLVWGL